MTTRGFVITLAAAALVLGCGGEEATTAAGDTGQTTETAAAADEIVDDMPTVPALKPGQVRFEFPEQIVKAGSEVVTCVYLERTTEDLYLKALESYQGKYGHHFVIFKIANDIFEEEPGTIRNCTNGDEMYRITPAISSVNFGLETFPDGMAVKVDKGTQLVLQQHYVNTTLKPIRVKDVMHLTTAPKTEVDTIAGFWGLSDLNFAVPADNEDYMVDFKCKVPHDMKLLIAGPHMHEWGTEIYVWAGPEDDMRMLIDLPEWDPEYRDFPPVEDYSKEPVELKAGDWIRTRCVFRNNTAEPLTFPGEMCASYGYFFPADAGKEEWTCAPGEEDTEYGKKDVE